MSFQPLILDFTPWELNLDKYPKHHSEVTPLVHPRLDMSPAQIQLLSALAPILSLEVGTEAVKRRNGELKQQLVNKNGFEVHLDVLQFRPNDLSLKTVDDYVVFEAKHEDREDEYGLISRNFIRKYKLPKGYDPNHVTSTLSSDGVLTIKAPPPPKNEGEKNERVVQVQQTGPAHLNIKDNKSKKATQNGDKAENNSI